MKDHIQKTLDCWPPVDANVSEKADFADLCQLLCKRAEAQFTQNYAKAAKEIESTKPEKWIESGTRNSKIIGG